MHTMVFQSVHNVGFNPPRSQPSTNNTIVPVLHGRTGTHQRSHQHPQKTKQREKVFLVFRKKNKKKIIACKHNSNSQEKVPTQPLWMFRSSENDKHSADAVLAADFIRERKHMNPAELRGLVKDSFPAVIGHLNFHTALLLDVAYCEGGGGFWWEAYGWTPVDTEGSTDSGERFQVTFAGLYTCDLDFL
jgi:hypothetical protein